MAGLPAFLLYFTVGTALIAGFAALYIRLTAHDEIALIRAGNLSAAIAFGGNLAGFSVPLEKAIEQAATESADTCYGCHGGRSWYRISFPYPRHPWPGMPEDTPDWAKSRPTSSDPRYALPKN